MEQGIDHSKSVQSPGTVSGNPLDEDDKLNDAPQNYLDSKNRFDDFPATAKLLRTDAPPSVKQKEKQSKRHEDQLQNTHSH